MVRRFLLLAAVAGLAHALPADAQYDSYQARYGAVVEVSIDNLLQMPESYVGKAVRTHGELEMLPAIGERRFSLRGTFGGRVLLFPMQEVASEFETQANRWLGKDVEVTGLVASGSSPSTGQAMVYIQFWGFLGPPDERAAASGPVTPATLEDLLTKPGKLDGKLVAVRGQFRGQNLFGDLPASSRKRSADWVIKDDVFAAWVTGRKPKGPGWVFDAEMKRDTGKWLEVTGRVSTARGVVTIEATSIVISKPPSATAAAQAPPPPPPPPRAKKPPVVVFSLPLDGERDVQPTTVFQVQFSKDLDEASLKDRVVLRYAGRAQPGDRELDSVKVVYDEGLRTLKIDPGNLLRPGRIVEVLLLPGILDIDGLALVARPGYNPAAGAADVLRFQIAAPGLFGVSR